MKEKQGILQDVTGTAQPEESKAKKCIRLVLAFVGMAFIAFVIVMAILNK